MNLRDLQYLVAVADHRHFGKAALACHVSQPTLSAQLSKLEAYLGVALLERTPRSVHVTPIGVLVVASARLALEHAGRVVAIARESRDPLAGSLVLGVIPTLAPYLVPLLLRPLRDRFPSLELSLVEEPTDRLLERLARHELDAAIVATPIDGVPALAAIPLFREPFWVAIPKGHPIATAERVTRADLVAAELLLLSDEHCLRNQALEACRYRARTPTPAMPDLRAASLETLLGLVASGIGCTLIPALAAGGARTSDAIELRELRLPGAERQVILAHREGFPRRRALVALAEAVREVVPRDRVDVPHPTDETDAVGKRRRAAPMSGQL